MWLIGPRAMRSLLFLLVILCAAPAAAETWRVAVEDQDVWPSYYHEAGRLRGIDVETALGTAAAIGVAIDWVEKPWARALAATMRGDLDAILAPQRTAGRERALAFPDEPLSFRLVSFVARPGVAIPWAGDPRALAGRTVLAPLGWSLDYVFVEGGPAREDAADQATVVRRVAAGRAALGLGNPPVLRREARLLGLGDAIAILDPPIRRIDSHLAFSRAAGRTADASRFSEALSAFLRSDDYAAILRRHGEEHQRPDRINSAARPRRRALSGRARISAKPSRLRHQTITRPADPPPSILLELGS